MAQTIESTLTASQKDSLEITDFIFHIIDPSISGDDQILPIDEVQLHHKQKKFFLDRLKEILTGTQYVFKPDAGLLKQKCIELTAYPGKLNEISRVLATDFTGRHNGSMSVGIFVVARVQFLAKSNNWKRLILLLKMDQSQSFSYERVEKNGKFVAIVNEVANSLSEDKNSIQKSAVIDADNYFAWDVLAYDRVKKPRLGDYFRAFLGVQERQHESVLTLAALSTVKQWAKRIPKDELPEGEDSASFSGRAYDYLKNNINFDSDSFIETVVRDENEERREKLKSQLKDKLTESGVYGQNFIPKPESLKRSETLNKMTTKEGVSVIFQGAREAVGIKVSTLPNGKTRITIETSSYSTN